MFQFGENLLERGLAFPMMPESTDLRFICFVAECLKGHLGQTKLFLSEDEALVVVRRACRLVGCDFLVGLIRYGSTTVLEDGGHDLLLTHGVVSCRSDSQAGRDVLIAHERACRFQLALRIIGVRFKFLARVSAVPLGEDRQLARILILNSDGLVLISCCVVVAVPFRLSLRQSLDQ